MRDVHDDVAQPEEGLGVERLREEVSQVVVRGDEGPCRGAHCTPVEGRCVASHRED